MSEEAGLRRWDPWWVICVAGIVVSAPALLAIYGFQDDYHLLWQSRMGALGTERDPFSFLGRPVTSLTLIPVLGLVKSVAELAWLRLAGLAGLLAFSFILDRALRSRGWTEWPRLVTGLLAATSPGALVYVGWSTCFPFAWGAVAALCGGLLATWAARQRHGTWPYWLISAVLLAISLMIYQPVAGAFLIPLFADALRLGRHKFNRQVLLPGILFAVVHLLYFAVFLILREPFQSGNILHGKVVIGSAPVGNLLNFWSGIIPAALGSWWSMDSLAMGAVAGVLSGILLVTGLLAGPWEAGSKRDPLSWLTTGQRLLALPGCLSLAVGAVVMAEGVFYHRTLFAVYALLAICIGQGLQNLVRLPGWWRIVSRGVTTGVLVLAISGAVFVFKERFVEPNAREFDAIQGAIEDQLKDVPRALFLVPGPRADLHRPQRFSIRSQEYGALGRDVSWALEPLVRMVLAEAGRLIDGKAPMVLVLPGTVKGLAERYPVVTVGDKPVTSYASMAEMVQAHPGEDTPFGPMMRLRESPEGWKLSPWLGCINTYFWNPQTVSYLYQLDLGWLMVTPQEKGNTNHVFHHSNLGSFWTSPRHYPYIKLQGTEPWAYVRADGSGPTYILSGDKPLQAFQVPSIGISTPPE